MRRRWVFCGFLTVIIFNDFFFWVLERHHQAESGKGKIEDDP
jgi:hypothetical protein